MYEIEASPAQYLLDKRRAAASNNLSQLMLIRDRASLQFVLVLIERRWVGLETLPLSNVQGNHCRLVAVTKRVLHTSKQDKSKEGQHWQATQRSRLEESLNMITLSIFCFAACGFQISLEHIFAKPTSTGNCSC